MNAQPIPQLVLHKTDNFENMFFNITHNWIILILASFIYLESLWLKMVDVIFFC